MDREPHWLGLRFRGSSGDDLATRVHATLAGVGIVLDPGLISYIASVMFGEGLDGLHCGYCGHRGGPPYLGRGRRPLRLLLRGPFQLPRLCPGAGHLLGGLLHPPRWRGPQGRILRGLFDVNCLCRKGSRCEGVHR